MNASRKRLLTVIPAAALALAIAPLAASAQAAPSYAEPGTETIHGTILSVNGKYDISVHDERGFVDNVSLHDGTIINPTGLTLAPNETVTIEGHAAGSTFVADEIDTPYSRYYAYPVPYPAYPVYPAPGPRIGVHFGGFGWGLGFRGRI